MRRIKVVVSVVAVLVLAATMAALPAVAGGKTDAGNNKNGWGAVTSQKATTNGGIGGHASDPDQDGVKGERREGIGNVARKDGEPGDHPGDHACFADKMDPDPNVNCKGKPGKG